MATKTNTEINGHRYFRITRTVGHKYVDGKKVPVKKQFYGTSKRNAELAYETWRAEQDKAEHTIDLMRTFGELAEEFNGILAVNEKYAIGTRRLYINAYEAHMDDMGLFNIPIGQLSHRHIQMAYNELNITSHAMATLHKYMRLLFYYLHRAGYCEDLLGLVVVPEKQQGRHQEDVIVWTDDEITMIKERMAGHWTYPIIMVSLYAGLRIGEILGLEWKDLDEKTIHVRRQNYRGYIKEPKAGSSRDIPMHPEIKTALDSVPHSGRYVFCTATGQLLDYHNVATSIRRAYKKYDIPQKKFHAYRATFCTNLCKAGVPIQVASKLMGHKNVSVTAKFYTLVEQDTMAEAILRL